MFVHYLEKNTHLYSNANIVHYSIFKQGTCKIFDGRKQSPSSTEKRTVQHLRNSTLEDNDFETPVDIVLSYSHSDLDCEGQSYFEQLKNKFQRVSYLKPQYGAFSFIPFTSKNFKPMFSSFQHLLTVWRKSMVPIMFDAAMFRKS